MKTKIVNLFVYLLLILFAVVALYPLIFLVTGSFQIDGTFSLRGYLEVFLLTPNYRMKFWSSMLLSLTIMAGQIILACFGAYGFAKFKFPMKNVFFYFMIILMMMPLQVTLVPNTIVFDRVGLIGSYWALILPGIFSAFGVFLLTQFFSSIPDSILEAAKIDGANHLQILFRIVIPSARAGIASLCILSFIDTWNMVEQPLVFLKDSAKYPLSVFLAGVNQTNPEHAFVCGILAVLPVFFLFLFLKDSLISGIENSNLK